MKKDNLTKLTSVKILKSLYEQFKFKTVNSSMNLQKLVNRSIDQYIHDNAIRELRYFAIVERAMILKGGQVMVSA